MAQRPKDFECGSQENQERKSRRINHELWNGSINGLFRPRVPEFQIQNCVPDIPDFHIPFFVFGCGFAALCLLRQNLIGIRKMAEP